MKTVKSPPKLVLQETPNWCFAAAEVMIRAYYDLASLSQYAIARSVTAALAEARYDENLTERWNIAQALDDSLNVQENGGINRQSNIVQIVRSQWNIFNHEATNGYFVQDLTPEKVLEEIANDRVFVVGNLYHYYVVYGCSDDGATLYARDPYGHGNDQAEIALPTIDVAILFRSRR